MMFLRYICTQMKHKPGWNECNNWKTGCWFNVKWTVCDHQHHHHYNHQFEAVVMFLLRKFTCAFVWVFSMKTAWKAFSNGKLESSWDTNKWIPIRLPFQFNVTESQFYVDEMEALLWYTFDGTGIYNNIINYLLFMILLRVFQLRTQIELMLFPLNECKLRAFNGRTT